MKAVLRINLIVLATSALAAISSPVALAADTAAAPAVTAARAPTDKAAYFDNTNLQNIWKDLEARQVLNQRVLEGGTHSINVRIVKENDAPLVHHKSVDVWVVMAGTATSVTGGELLNPTQRANADDMAGTAIRGGVEQPLKQGDVIFVPPGVPHGFKNVKGFRAFLIRYDVQTGAATP